MKTRDVAGKRSFIGGKWRRVFLEKIGSNIRIDRECIAGKEITLKTGSAINIDIRAVLTALEALDKAMR